MKVKVTVSCIAEIGDDTPEHLKQALEDGELGIEEIGGTSWETIVEPVVEKKGSPPG